MGTWSSEWLRTWTSLYERALTGSLDALLQVHAVLGSYNKIPAQVLNSPFAFGSPLLGVSVTCAAEPRRVRR